LEQAIISHIRKVDAEKTTLKESSDLYDFIISNRYEVADMVRCLKFVLLSKEQHVLTMDPFFFTKGLLYSSIRNHSVEEQIEFMYHLDKLNLLIHYIPKYLDTLQNLSPKTLSIYQKKLPLDSILMNFHTISKTIDSRKPDQSLEYQKMWRVTNSRVQQLIKYNHAIPGRDGQPLRFEDLEYQQVFDLMEGYSYTKKGSSKALTNILLLVQDHFATGKM